MKFGYRDRIILLIVCVIVVLSLGIFVFIKPKWEKLNTNQGILTTAKNEWEVQLTEFANIPTKQENIKKKHQQAEEVALNFSDEMNSVELDEFLQSKFFNNDANIEGETLLVDGLSVTDELSNTMSYYYMTPNIVTYPLFEYADLDGSLAKSVADKRHKSDVLSARNAQSVGAGTSSLTFRINRENTMAFIDAVEKYAKDNKDAMIINSVSIGEYDFNANLDVEGKTEMKQVITHDEDGNEVIEEVEVAVDAKPGDKMPGFTNVTFNYQVFYMQEPTTPDVGPSYDATIWDGDGWRNYTSSNNSEAQ